MVVGVDPVMTTDEKKRKRSSGGLTVGTYSEGNLLVVYEMSRQV